MTFAELHELGHLRHVDTTKIAFLNFSISLLKDISLELLSESLDKISNAVKRRFEHAADRFSIASCGFRKEAATYFRVLQAEMKNLAQKYPTVHKGKVDADGNLSFDDQTLTSYRISAL